MDTDIILAKLESLRRCITRVEDKTPAGAEVLKNDYTKTPATMGETFVSLAEAQVIPKELAEQLRRAVGFRNISVHEYEKIDWEIVFSICTRNLTSFRDFTAAVLEFLGLS